MKASTIVAGLLAATVGLAGCTLPSRGDVYSREETRQAWDVDYGEVTDIDPVVIEGQRTWLGRVGGGLVGWEAGRAIGGSGSTGRVVGAVAGGPADHRQARQWPLDRGRPGSRPGLRRRGKGQGVLAARRRRPRRQALTSPSLASGLQEGQRCRSCWLRSGIPLALRHSKSRHLVVRPCHEQEGFPRAVHFSRNSRCGEHRSPPARPTCPAALPACRTRRGVPRRATKIDPERAGGHPRARRHAGYAGPNRRCRFARRQALDGSVSESSRAPARRRP